MTSVATPAPTATGAGPNKRRLGLCGGFTPLYLAAEVVVGDIVTRSLVLLADAGHMLTDVGGLAFALLAIRVGERALAERRTSGFYRAEILAALANAVVLIVISLHIPYEAYQRFRNPPEVASAGMLVVASIGRVVDVAGALILRAGSSESLNVKGAYFEVLSALLTSVGVMIAGVIAPTAG